MFKSIYSFRFIMDGEITLNLAIENKYGLKIYIKIT